MSFHLRRAYAAAKNARMFSTAVRGLIFDGNENKLCKMTDQSFRTFPFY